MTLRPHTSHEFEHELTDLREQITLMGRKVDGAMADCQRALVDVDSSVALRVIESDREIDSLELAIDHECMAIMARRQPVASDLRFTSSAFKLVVDLERIGDLAVDVAERVIEMGSEPPLLPYDKFAALVDRARAMVSGALTAFLTADEPLAQRTVAEDDELDREYRAVADEVLVRARQQPEALFRATRLNMIAKYIERMGDHATNIAELAIFIATGTDVRHPGARDGQAPQPGRS